MISEVIHKEIQVDSQLLFQRSGVMPMKMPKYSLSMSYVLFQPLCLSPMDYQETQQANQY